MSQEYVNQKPSGFKNRVENVAIVGAGGQIGKFIVDKLLEKGHFQVTAISREGSTSSVPEGVVTKSINYDNHPSIVNALKGQEVLIITMSVRAPQDQQSKLIKAAADAGVPWVLPNEFGSDTSDDQVNAATMIGVGKKKEREYIESLGVSKWIGLSCMFWYEYSLSGPKLYGFDIAKRSITWFDDGTQRLDTSTWPQTGRAVANLLSLPILPEDENDKKTTLSSYNNKFAHVSSFTVNQKDMFESLKRVTNTEDKDWTFDSRPPTELYKEGQEKLRGGDRMGFAQMLYSRFFYPDGAGLMSEKYGLDNETLGLPKEDFDEFTKEAVRLSETEYFSTLGR